jgi:hypothetical protein
MNPKDLTTQLEKNPTIPSGNDERFSGYGIMGLTFDSGHVLALRRFVATSIGPAYTAIWHRNPQGVWTIYQNVPAQQGCPRYFGAALSQVILQEIKITWSDANQLTITMSGDANLTWNVSLTATPVTRFMNLLSSYLPEFLWQNTPFLKLMGGMAGVMLQAGHLGLLGIVPNGQSFLANPKQIWMVSSSTATLNNENLGTPAPLSNQTKLGDFWIPQQGIFAIGISHFETYDQAKHKSS